MIRVWIAAPGYALRTGLRALLGTALAEALGIQVVGESASLQALEPRLMGVDVILSVAETAATVDFERLAAAGESRQALLLLTEPGAPLAWAGQQAWRAWGALPFDCGPEDLALALAGLHQGLWVFSPSLTSTLEWRGETGEALVEPLTEREREVLQAVALGLANKQIALRLGITEHTVKFHISSLYAKLGAANRTEAVRLGVQHGLVFL